MKRRGLSGRLLVAVGASVVGALVAITAVFMVLVTSRLDADVSDRLHSRAAAGLANVATTPTGLTVREAPNDSALDGGLWVFEGRRAIERPPAPPRIQAAASALARSRVERDVTVGGVRMLAEPILQGRRQVGSVVAALSLAPSRHARNVALGAAIVFDVLILIGALLLARLIVGRALRPVAEMTALAEEWSEHDPDHRFGLGPPHDELTQLGATLDRLLARLAASVRHEQRFSSEVSHELRTPLARLRARAEVALHPGRTDAERRAALQEVLEQTDRIASVVETLVASAQHEAGAHLGTATVGAVLATVSDAFAADADQRGISLTVRPGPASARVGADLDLATRILAPVVGNAIAYGRSAASVEAIRTNGVVRFLVRDDGPGTAPGEAETIFAPGQRGAAASATPGSGLGLSLSRRLARSAGGDVQAVGGDGGGRFEVTLPAAS